MNNRPLLVAIAGMLLITLGMGAYLLSMRKHALSDVPAAYPTPVAPPVSGPTERVTLYVAYDDPGILLPRNTSIPLPEGRQQRARELLRALLSQYLEKSSSHPLAPGSDIRDVYLVDPDLAVIDLNADFANGHRSGVLVEELTVASLVQTLAANIQGITRVKFLVGGQERDTLAGHADLADAYSVSQVAEMANALQASQ